MPPSFLSAVASCSFPSCKNLNTGRTKGKKPRTTVWGKLLICECGHTFNMRKWDRSDRQVQNSYQCYSSVRTGSYESRKKKGLPLDGICQTPMIPEWRLQMMANLIFRKYLSQKDKVLALANSILEAHIGDTEETQNKEAILKSKQDELAKLSKKIDGYIEMRADGDLSREAFRMKCAELEPRMQQLQKIAFMFYSLFTFLSTSGKIKPYILRMNGGNP